MAVAQVRDAKPLPPFKEWAFEESHYLQYLSDILSVHSAMEQALVDVLSADAYKEPLPGIAIEASVVTAWSKGLAHNLHSVCLERFALLLSMSQVWQ